MQQHSRTEPHTRTGVSTGGSLLFDRLLFSKQKVSVKKILAIMNTSSSSANNITSEAMHLNPPNRQCFMATSLEPVPFASVQQFIFLLYTFTSVASVIGNLLVIIVQLFGSRRGPYNIGKYLCNLAVSDIALSVMSVPFTYTNIVKGHWTFPAWLCPMAQYFQLLSVFITSTTLTIIGIERFIVTLHPLSRSCTWFKSHSSFLVLLTWLIGALYSYIPVDANYASYFLLDGELYIQCVTDSQPLKMRLFMIFNFLLTFLLPMIIMTASYAAIMNKLNENGNNFIAKYFSPNSQRCAWIYVKKEDEVTCAHVTQRSRAIDHRSKTIKMMLIVLLMYAICWSPIKLFQFLQHNGIIFYCTELEYYIMIYVYIACHWLAMANSMINPIIYSFMSKAFRNNFRGLVKAIRANVSFAKLRMSLICTANYKLNATPSSSDG